MMGQAFYSNLRLSVFHVIINVHQIRNCCQGSVAKVLEGKNYKGAVRTHKCIPESSHKDGVTMISIMDHMHIVQVVQKLEMLISDFHKNIGQVPF